MGLFSSEDESDDGTVRFKPVTTDGNRVLGYLSEDGETELVWVPDTKFRTETNPEIDEVME